MNLYTALKCAWPAQSASPAILGHPQGPYTWADLDGASARLAQLLHALRLKGHAARPAVVAAQVDKSVEALCLYLATLRAGLVFLPLNPAYRAPELEHVLRDARPSLLVCRPQDTAWVSPLAQRCGVAHCLDLDAQRGGSLLAQALHFGNEHAIVSRRPQDLAAILYTSGTTGRSKGALLSHGNLLSNARTLLQVWDWRQDDCLVHALPIFHIHGLFVAIHCALLSGTPMRWLPQFDAPAVLQAIADPNGPRATVFMGVPTMYGRLLAEPGLDHESTHAMRLFISGSAPLLPSDAQAFERRTGHRILERYGMSETGMICSNPARAREGERVSASVGRPLPGVEVRVADDFDRVLPVGQVGGVQLRGPNVFGGYLGLPEQTAQSFSPDGWFRTGDLGRFDDRGYLYLEGRAKDLIISGGFNVYPAEVETELNALADVTEAVVIGVPHADWGEAVLAIVVHEAADSGSRGHALCDALLAALRERLAAYKCPKAVVFVEALPRNAMGKVQKQVLREHHGQYFAPSLRPRG